MPVSCPFPKAGGVSIFMEELPCSPEQTEIARLQKRLERERKARTEAERIAEQGLRSLYKKQQEVELLQAVAVASNESRGFPQALQAALHSICTYTGWPLGHVYLPDPLCPRELLPSSLWHMDVPERYHAFREVTAATHLTAGIGLPGQVLANGHPLWISDVGQAPNFPRIVAAQQHGLHAGFAFAVRVEEQCVAILEFFTGEVLEADEALLRVMGHIATQLSRVVEREQAAERIQHLAYHDTLTTLPNRRLFQDRLNVSLAQTQHYERELGVLFLDLDRFKVINDSLGHQSGDELLQQVATRLLRCVRQGDTVARSGGDEFVVLLPEVMGTQGIYQVAERILAVMQPPFVLGGQEVYVTFSVGGSTYPVAGTDAETLLKNADLALYKAKQQGRNRYELFTPQMASQAQETLLLETSLRKALIHEEFLVYYQPQIDVASGSIIGMEALVRWQHPHLGLIPPVQFIPMAEETGLIVPLGAWVLRTACAQVQAWHRQGQRPLRLSVNLSLRQFQQPDIVMQVQEILQETGLDPALLDLEITESIAVENLQGTQCTLYALKGLGVRLSLDDFGTGYSSLSSLSTLPMDTVKIDKSFIQTMLTDPRNAAIAQSIIHMARSLNLQVIAEGVEVPQQRQFLADHHCDSMQGYLFSKPLTASDFARLLEQETAEQLQRAA